MKTNTIKLLLPLLAASASFAALPAQAYDHDKTGYFDDHHQHHPYVYHHHHRGYWQENNGVRVFINV
jgi:hypothetical protein